MRPLLFLRNKILEVTTIFKELRINEQIRVPQVRLIGSDGEQLDVMPIKEAQQMQQDIFTYAPRSNGAVDYRNFVQEVLSYGNKENI